MSDLHRELHQEYNRQRLVEELRRMTERATAAERECSRLNGYIVASDGRVKQLTKQNEALHNRIKELEARIPEEDETRKL